ncbi:GNAT family N-acetyltransferase [Planobispora siamensis]|uniref:N-acetyltransferase n=1 Tax=Planobispora siamensis TaxID=936338 RepID=A0A8J3SAU3_9ACTN|nr:GNAT family N-acetyltransferase [Planobispora siamensis]GIH90623.1 N-acetyltransferase [Planobispora siamensis]
MRVFVRDGVQDDVEAVLRIKNETWRAAYRGLLPQDFLDGLSVTPGALEFWREWTTSGGGHLLVGGRSGDTGGGPGEEIAGFSVFGSERDPEQDPEQDRERDRAADGEGGEAGGNGEVYAIYVLPGHWSTGLGLALMTRSIERLREMGHREAGLWVLEGNARARRFYERFGFTLSGRVQDVPGLPFPATEVHYRMPIGPRDA